MGQKRGHAALLWPVVESMVHPNPGSVWLAVHVWALSESNTQCHTRKPAAAATAAAATSGRMQESSGALCASGLVQWRPQPVCCIHLPPMHPSPIVRCASSTRSTLNFELEL